MKRILSVLLSITILFGSFIFCTGSAVQEQSVISSAEEGEDIPVINQNISSGVSVSAQGAVLYCANNGQVLFSKNENQKMKMASTTKVMTALLTLEAALSYNKTVTFTKDMVAEGSSMYLEIGDKVTLKDLAAGMLLASGNDAANAAAMTISGSQEKFAQLMNTRAAQIGMTNTHFVTPSGLDDDEHYSTAYDMALLLAYAMENEDFAKITSQKSMKIDFQYPENESHTYGNHNRLLSLYKYCIGGKTGFTKAAGRCLVSVAEKDGLRLIAATLNAPSDWDDHQKMFDYGFSKLCAAVCDDTKEQFEIPVVGSEVTCVKASAKTKSTVVTTPENKDKIKRFVYVPAFVYAPIGEGEQVGKIIYKINGDIVAENTITVNSTILSLKKANSFWNIIKGIFSNG